MKKSIAVFLCMLCLCACTKENNNAMVKNDTPAENHVSESENDVKISESAHTATQEKQVSDVLPLKKALYSRCELHPDYSEILVRSNYSLIYPDDSIKEEYPVLFEALQSAANMTYRAKDDEFDNQYAFALEETATYGFDTFVTYTSMLDHTVKRSDSIVVSIVEDSVSNFSAAGECRNLLGLNYDSKTGETIFFDDIVKNTDGVISAVNEKIHSGMWTGDLYSENAVKDYFENKNPEDISYTIGYNGVTVYFNPGEIADRGYGLITVTLAFDEYNELFDEKYMSIPEEYAAGFCIGAPDGFDINNDGKAEQVIISEYTDDEYEFYRELDIVTTDGNYYAEDFYAYGFEPYYVKTKDNRHLLYIFSEGAEDFDRLMRLNVYEITDGKILKLGEMPAAPSHDNLFDGTDIFSLPLNPQKMYFDFFNDAADFVYSVFTDYFEITSNGLPKKIGEDEEIPAPPEFDVENFEEYEYTSDDIFGSVWYGYRFVDAESGMPRDCSTDIMSSDFVKLEFFNDARGLIKLFGRYNDFTWGEDTPASISMYFNDGLSYYPCFYTDSSENDGNLWMFIQVNEDILWLYKK